MGVVSLARGNNLGGLLVVSLGLGILRLGHHGLLHVVGSGEFDSGSLGHLLSSVLVHVATHVVVHGASGVVSTLRSLVVATSVVVTLEVSALSVSVSLLLSSSHLLEAIVATLHGESLQELGDLVVEFVSGGDVLPVVVLVVELLELLESKFILGLFVLDVSEFLKLVMADLELSLVKESVVAVLESLLGLVGSLEADESVGFLLFVNGEHLDALNFSVLLEDTGEVLFGELGLEVLDVEVASLLGVLVLDGLSEELFLSLGGSEGGLNVKLFAVTHVSTVKSFDGFEGLLGSVLVIVLVFGYKAHERESTGVGLGNLDEGADISVRLEHLNQLFVGPFFGVVLDV